MKIYVAGSIRGGRDRQPFLAKLVETLQFYGHVVLSEHVGSPEIDAKGEVLKSKTIFARDIRWLEEADAVIADVTVPSLGVGFEVCYAQRVLGKPILCLTSKPNVSAMIEGNPTLEYGWYAKDGDAIKRVVKWIRFQERKMKGKESK